MRKDTNGVISFKDFTKQIDMLKKEWDFLDKIYELEFDEFINHIYSLDVAVELLEFIFEDENELIAHWIYENNFGEYNNETVRDLYGELLYNYLVKTKGSDDLSQNEECSQEK